MIFFETSALTGDSVQEVFSKCARQILSKIESGTPSFIYTFYVVLCCVVLCCVVLCYVISVMYVMLCWTSFIFIQPILFPFFTHPFSLSLSPSLPLSPSLQVSLTLMSWVLVCNMVILALLVRLLVNQMLQRVVVVVNLMYICIVLKGCKKINEKKKKKLCFLCLFCEK